MTRASRVLIVNPVRERRQRAPPRRRPGGAAGRDRDGPHAGAGRCDRDRAGVVGARRGDLRLLRRRHLQRGDQRHHRRRRRRLRPRWRHERAAASARSSARPGPGGGADRDRPPAADLARRDQRPPVRLQRRHRVRRGARAAGSTVSGAAPTASAPATSGSPSPSCGRSSEHRLRYDPVLEIEGLGRAAFALVANCSPYTYAGRLGLRIAPDASFEGGLDIVAPREVRMRAIPRLATQAVRGGHGVARRAHAATTSTGSSSAAIGRCRCRSTARTSATSSRRRSSRRDALTVSARDAVLCRDRAAQHLGPVAATLARRLGPHYAAHHGAHVHAARSRRGSRPRGRSRAGSSREGDVRRRAPADRRDPDREGDRRDRRPGRRCRAAHRRAGGRARCGRSDPRA